MRGKVGWFVVLVLLLSVQPVMAGQIDWTNWIGGSATSANGVITSSVGPITVSYSNPSAGVSFIQTGSGTNYWIERIPKPYTGNLVISNAPPAAEMVAIQKSANDIVTFSQAVINPIMAFVSWNTSPVTFSFTQPFHILGYGSGYWGNGSATVSDNVLIPSGEFHGVIQFEGSLTSISWSTTGVEYWHGFTFGLPDQTNPVPEPCTMLLLGSGLAGVAAFRRKFKRA